MTLQLPQPLPSSRAAAAAQAAAVAQAALLHRLRPTAARPPLPRRTAPKVPATVEVKNGTAAVSADNSKLTAVSGEDSLTLDLSADSTVRTVSLTGDVVAALAGAKNGAALYPAERHRLHSTVRR